MKSEIQQREFHFDLLHEYAEDYSEVVLRELLINALAHRDYSRQQIVEIRKYPGFALSSYGDPKDWTRIELGRELSETGDYQVAAEGLEPGIPYQYQPVIYNDLIEVRGEYALLTVPMEETNL